MSDPVPLNEQEELLWRALMRVIIALPRTLDDDLLRSTGLSLTEYSVLMNLSEAEDREMRMTDLAKAAALSASRITRVIEGMQSRGHVTKRRSDADGRGNIATLTPAGLKRLQDAYAVHLASARRRVIDQLDSRLVPALAPQLEAIANGLL